MPKLDPICVACEDTLKNSKGDDCYCCLMAGRIKVSPQATTQQPKPQPQLQPKKVKRPLK